MQVTPPARRSQVENRGGWTTVVIPGRLRPAALFLLVWLSFWTFGGVTAIKTLFQSVRNGSPQWFLAVWLVGWVFGEFAALGSLGYILAGREIITLRPGELEIRLEVLGFGFSRQYEVAKVRNLRVSVQARTNQFPATLAFDYGAKTVRFARGIDEAEGILVLRDLRETGLLSSGP